MTAIFFLNLTLAMWANSASSAVCTYNVIADWGYGFQASIEIFNNTAIAVNSWHVSWQYTPSGNLVDLGSTWNAHFSGDNPYAASDQFWNNEILPGDTVVFGFIGTTGSIGTAEAGVVVTGCP